MYIIKIGIDTTDGEGIETTNDPDDSGDSDDSTSLFKIKNKIMFVVIGFVFGLFVFFV